MDIDSISALIARCFGDSEESIEAVDARTRQLVTTTPTIVWEGDAQTFQFSFVSPAAERLLGYPAQRWVDEPTFWTDVIIAPDDRDEAIAYCALATAKRCDHVFEYRARRADGTIVWLRDYVQVLVGPRKVATKLRGIMVDITAEKKQARRFEERPTYRSPSNEQLTEMT